MAVLASASLGLMALLVAVPLGVGAGTWLHEYPSEQRGVVLRRLVVAMSGVPSVVYGVFGALVLLRLGVPVLIAAGATLGLVVLPDLVRRVDRALDSVPGHHREAAIALGATRFQVVTRVVLPGARRQLAGAVLLGGLQAVGEAAPLLALGVVAAAPLSVLQGDATMTVGLLALTVVAGGWADQLRRAPKEAA